MPVWVWFTSGGIPHACLCGYGLLVVVLHAMHMWFTSSGIPCVGVVFLVWVQFTTSSGILCVCVVY